MVTLRLLLLVATIIGVARSLSPAPGARRRTSSVSLNVASPPQQASNKGKEVAQEATSDSKIRPLHQNWWPVTAVCALDPTRPNPVELLGMKLVLFPNQKEEWKCLRDRCAHRFAPLSEGRLVKGNGDACLQCAYHGWEFADDGSCHRVPQQEESQTNSVRPIQDFPVRIAAGMVFVWADPSTEPQHDLPTFPDLCEWVEARGDGACFMRDLPYGYELLAENLLDLAHLPFSHHGVGGLSRDLGRPLPFKMLSNAQKSDDNPLYEAVLEDAGLSDPTMMARYSSGEASLNLGFYEASHVRYKRTMNGMDSYVALYLCPLSATKSRVFLFNVFAAMLPKKGAPPPKKTKLQGLKESIKGKLSKLVIGRVTAPVRGHMMGHSIFDGDGIFLHKQGDRMEREGLSYQDYDTPVAADIMVNVFRRYLNQAATLTRQAGHDSMADAALSTSGYDDSLPRSTMLDRYESHTKHCKICSSELALKQTTKARLSIAHTILLGSVGASTTALLSVVAMMGSQISVPTSVLRAIIIATASTAGASVGVSKANKKLEKQIQEFFFEDYIHAEKN